METGSLILNKCLIGLSALMGLLFGSDPTVLKFVYALLIFQSFDIFTGLGSMIMKKEKFDYRLFFDGIMKKVMMLVAVSFGHFVDKFQILGTNGDIKIQTAIVSAWLMVEIISVLGNFKKVGLNIPVIEKYIKLD